MRKLALTAACILAAASGALLGVKGDAIAQVAGQDFYLHCIGDPLSCNEEAIPTVTNTTTETQTVTGPTTTVTQTATTTVTTTVPPAHHVYVGARITGQFYVQNYGATNNADAPFTGSLDPKGSWTLFEQHVGKPLSFVHWGGAGSAWPPSDFNQTAAQRAWDNGAFTMYGLSLPKTATDAILANNATAINNLKTLASQMKAWGKPLIFRPLWEMNGSWFTWGRQNYTPAQYVTIWRNMHAAFDSVDADNVSWAWVPNSCSSTTVCASTDNVPDPSPWFPGNSYVDWVGFERYVKNGYMTPTQWGDPIYNVLRALAPNKPIIIGEMGVVAEATAPGKHQFLADFLSSWLPAHPAVAAVSYFNDDGDTPNVQLEEGDGINVFNSNSLSSWKTNIASDYYLGEVTQTFPTSGKVPIP